MGLDNAALFRNLRLCNEFNFPFIPKIDINDGTQDFVLDRGRPFGFPLLSFYYV